MYVCYVDESGDPGRNGSEYLLLGGAALFEGQWRNVRQDLEQLLATHFPVAANRPSEIHMADLRRGKGLFRGLTPAQNATILKDLCKLATDLLSVELRFFTVIAHKPTWFASHPGATGDELYVELFEDLSSRFDLYLRRRNAEGAPSKGIMIADPHKADLSKALRKNYHKYQQIGTRWGRIYNLIETVFFLASDESPGLQLADLCAYSVWRLLIANDNGLAAQIAGVFDREPLASIKDPGKWHGVKSVCGHVATRVRLESVWKY